MFGVFLTEAEHRIGFATAQASTFPTILSGDDDEDEDDEIRFQTVSRLTISFAPDGTQISRFKSSLLSSFSNLMTEDELKDTVLEAFQIWAQHSAVNVGFVTDSGDDFGIGGFSQGDPRFGDIRVGAVPMAGDVFAVAVPNIDFVSGTWSGDLLFNSDANFVDADHFFSVALHEAGHVLGLGHTSDVTSVMHPTAQNSVLNANDIADLVALYGMRRELDPTEEDDEGHKEEIENDSEIDGIIPLVVFGDIENGSDVDLFRFEPIDGYRGSITFQLISRNVSLLRSQLKVLDNDDVQLIDVLSDLDTVTESSVRGSDISFQVDNQSDDNEYTIQIESVGENANRFGSYALVTKVDGNLVMGAELVEPAIRKNYGDLGQEEVQELFLNELESAIQDDLHTNDTVANATLLMPPLNIALHSAYRIQASIADATDIDFYQLTALDSVMSVRVNGLRGSQLDEFGLIANVMVLDPQLQPIAGETKVNGNGELLVEFAGLVAGSDYFISVVADKPNSINGTGNYDLNVAFNSLPRAFDELGSGWVSPQKRTEVHSLYVARTQLFHFGLSGLHPSPNSDATIWMSIYDEDGVLKYRVATRTNEPRTAKSVILRPGSYSVRVSFTSPGPAVTPAELTIGGTPIRAKTRVMKIRRQQLQRFTYRVEGIGISEPTGPEVIDASEDPFSPCDKSGSDFCYPNDRFSPDPFIFVGVNEVDVATPVTDPSWTDANAWYWQIDWLG